MSRTSARLATIAFGGWFQRTTLHLSEVYDLFALGRSSLNLSASKLSLLHQSLSLISISREAGYLEYIAATTVSGINIRYYEDGLYILETESTNIDSARRLLTDYFEASFHPAISYIFSLGAPTPKILAGINNPHSMVIAIGPRDPTVYIKNHQLGDVYSQIKSGQYYVLKTPQYIVISSPSSIRDLIEVQIFFREFKDQLEKYLNIHREIWEEISSIKERRYLRGSEIETVRSRLDNYQKTISLINSRLSQMGAYVNTRASIARQLNLEEPLVNLFRYKFETLTDTHSYIKELWKMTQDYLNSAIQVVLEVKNQSATNSIQSLRLITTVGVLSGIVGYISKDSFPVITMVGVWYYICLILLTWGVNQLVSYVFKNLKYELKFNK